MEKDKDPVKNVWIMENGTALGCAFFIELRGLVDVTAQTVSRRLQKNKMRRLSMSAESKCDSCVYNFNNSCQLTYPCAYGKNSITTNSTMPHRTDSTSPKYDPCSVEITDVEQQLKHLREENTQLKEQLLICKQEAVMSFWQELKDISTMDPRIVSVATGDKLAQDFMTFGHRSKGKLDDYVDGSEYIILDIDNFENKKNFKDIAEFLGLPVYATRLYVGVNRHLLDYSV